MQDVLNFYFTQFMSTHYGVKHRCFKFLNYMMVICIRWLTSESSI